ncbi:hypothetical protein B0H17DRAFT_1330952 [Mycena rosella]|uniref:Uncharacterized protein n=1 Tax=Mycena rosella TaxID=1033263 RepID=A0AAD7GF75_MYCRO|nr:hypothetical protein B0H17DRAFT_1330952 [Mycena rosella]
MFSSCLSLVSPRVVYLGRILQNPTTRIQRASRTRPELTPSVASSLYCAMLRSRRPSLARPALRRPRGRKRLPSSKTACLEGRRPNDVSAPESFDHYSPAGYSPGPLPPATGRFAAVRDDVVELVPKLKRQKQGSWQTRHSAPKSHLGSLPVKEGLRLYMVRVDCDLISGGDISLDVDEGLLEEHVEVQQLFLAQSTRTGSCLHACNIIYGDWPNPDKGTPPAGCALPPPFVADVMAMYDAHHDTC